MKNPTCRLYLYGDVEQMMYMLSFCYVEKMACYFSPAEKFLRLRSRSSVRIRKAEREAREQGMNVRREYDD